MLIYQHATCINLHPDKFVLYVTDVQHISSPCFLLLCSWCYLPCSVYSRRGTVQQIRWSVSQHSVIFDVLLFLLNIVCFLPSVCINNRGCFNSNLISTGDTLHRLGIIVHPLAVPHTKTHTHIYNHEYCWSPCQKHTYINITACHSPEYQFEISKESHYNHMCSRKYS